MGTKNFGLVHFSALARWNILSLAFFPTVGFDAVWRCFPVLVLASHTSIQLSLQLNVRSTNRCTFLSAVQRAESCPIYLGTLPSSMYRNYLPCEYHCTNTSRQCRLAARHSARTEASCLIDSAARVLQNRSAASCVRTRSGSGFLKKRSTAGRGSDGEKGWTVHH